MSGDWANIFKMVRLVLPIMAPQDSKHTSVLPIIHVLNTCDTSVCCPSSMSVVGALYNDANLVGAWCETAHERAAMHSCHWTALPTDFYACLRGAMCGTK
jgi:hypothetical protein